LTSLLRLIVGVKLAWLINDQGEVVDWTWATANEPDNVFRPLATGYDGETIALADMGLREKDAPTQNIKCCCRDRCSPSSCVQRDHSFLQDWSWERFVPSRLRGRPMVSVAARRLRIVHQSARQRLTT
jgi:hypothetical protein